MRCCPRVVTFAMFHLRSSAFDWTRANTREDGWPLDGGWGSDSSCPVSSSRTNHAPQSLPTTSSVSSGSRHSSPFVSLPNATWTQPVGLVFAASASVKRRRRRVQSAIGTLTELSVST